MFVRATTIHADHGRLDEGIAFVRDHVMPATDELDGSVGCRCSCPATPAS